jgi:phospholipid/cholesterol/gamma-HCH transport system substrate-binding protein
VKPIRERNPILVGAISVAVLLALVVFALSLNTFTALRGVYVVGADFADAAGLVAGNEVRVAGLKVGKVRSVKLAPADASGVRDRVRVMLEIKSGFDLGDATGAEIKLKTLLGAKFVDVTPMGGKPFIGPGGRIPLDRTRVPFEIYQVTNGTVGTVGRIDAKALNNAVRQLGTLFDDPNGNFGRALRGLAAATKGLDQRNVELQSLLRDGATITRVLASRSDALGRILDSGSALLTALGERQDSLQRFVTGTNDLAAQVASLIRDNRTQLDPALRDLHTALEVVRADLGPLEHALKVLGPSAQSFARVFTQGTWGDVYLQTVLDLPVPPLGVPGALPAKGSPLAAILTGATK